MGLTESTFGLEVIASDKVFFRGQAQAMNLPVIGGPWMILPHHEDLIAILVPGLMTAAKFLSIQRRIRQILTVCVLRRQRRELRRGFAKRGAFRSTI